jgi:hypothetical protein
MSANISKPKLREKLDSLFVALSGITQELATFVSVTVTGALSAASASITGALTAASVTLSGALSAASATVSGNTTLGGLTGSKATNTTAATTTWTLSATELNKLIVEKSGTTGGSTDIIATPTSGKIYLVYNNGTGSDIVFKATGQTGVTVATAKSALVMGNGTDFIRVTADA